MLQKKLKALADTALGHKLRNLTNIRPPREVRPFGRHLSVSDLFFWRVDEEWDTIYHVPNMITQFYPESLVKDPVSIIFFDESGMEVHRVEKMLFSRSNFTFRCSDYLARGMGTFCCFHDTRGERQFESEDCLIVERGYLALQRKGDSLSSYVHGNLKAVSKGATTDKIKFLTNFSTVERAYRPQVAFNDCYRFEVIYINPTRVSQSIRLTLHGSEGGLDQKIARLPPGGLKLFAVDRNDVITLEGHSRVDMWRPIIIKYYESHYDVFHS